MLHSFRIPHHLLAIDLLLEGPVLVDDSRPLRSILDSNKDSIQVKRLLDEIERPFLDAFHRSVDVSVAGDHHDRRINPVCDKFVQHLRSIHSRHLDVTEDDIVFFFIYHGQGSRPVFCQVNIIALIGQNLLKRVPDRSFIVYN